MNTMIPLSVCVGGHAAPRAPCRSPPPKAVNLGETLQRIVRNRREQKGFMENAMQTFRTQEPRTFAIQNM